MPGAAPRNRSCRARSTLEGAGCDPIFSEKISTRVKVRPEFTKAMEYTRTIKQAVPHHRVIFTVHEMKRLGRGRPKSWRLPRSCAALTFNWNC
ncbi:hypothetical protein [Nonomuraea sp. NPDC003201]